MRIAYACRELAVDHSAGPGGRMFASALARAAEGHEVYLVSDALSAGRSRALLSGDSPSWLRAEPARPDHHYFTDAQAYADRVYDTLRALPVPLDLVEFAGRGGEAFTVLRARRLLGEFPGTRVTVAPDGPGPPGHPAAPGPYGTGPAAPRHVPAPPATYEDTIDAFAEDYCRTHADPPGLAATMSPPRRVDLGAEPDAVRRDAPDDLVSVIIPLYDQGRYVREAIASVRRCGYDNVEIIVVDDGSADRATVEVFTALEGVVKIRQANAGLPAARNAGLAAARGRYVLPLDADDMLPPGFVRPAVEAMRRDPGLRYVTGRLRYFGLLDYTHVPVGYVPDLSLIMNTQARATGLFDRETLLALGGYDIGLPANEDWDLHIRFHKAGHDSDVLPVEGQLYRRHAESMTIAAGRDARIEHLQLLIAKHADLLEGERGLRLLLTMTHLWKTGHEPSASARLQRGRSQSQA
jgi:GT2 family glycosyltransferase